MKTARSVAVWISTRHLKLDKHGRCTVCFWKQWPRYLCFSIGISSFGQDHHYADPHQRGTSLGINVAVAYHHPTSFSCRKSTAFKTRTTLDGRRNIPSHKRACRDTDMCIFLIWFCSSSSEGSTSSISSCSYSSSSSPSYSSSLPTSLPDTSASSSRYFFNLLEKNCEDQKCNKHTQTRDEMRKAEHRAT